MAFVSYVSFGVLTCSSSVSLYPVSLACTLSLSLSLSLTHSLYLSSFSCLAVSTFLDVLRYPFYLTRLSFSRSLSRFRIFVRFARSGTPALRLIIGIYFANTHYEDDENGAFGSFKLDGLSDFTYTRFNVDGQRRARSALSYFTRTFRRSARILVEAEENRHSSSHPRTDVTHQLSALQGNARTDRFCRSFHSSRPRATAMLTLLMHARVRTFVCAYCLSVCACVRQSAAIPAASTNQNGRIISFFVQRRRSPRSLARVIVRVRIHSTALIYDAVSWLFLLA